MNVAASRAPARSPGDPPERVSPVESALERAAHFLPTQAPIQVFVHHNTLHAIEDRPFDEAVNLGAALFGCHAYLPEDRYREKLARGRILSQDLVAELLDDLGEDADHLIGFLGTRFHLRLAMLQHPLRLGSDVELRWLIAETDALRKFRSETPPDVRERMIDETRRWAMRDLRRDLTGADPKVRRAAAALFERFGESRIEQWSTATWEAFTLQLLWSVCRDGLRDVQHVDPPAAAPVRHHDVLLRATGIGIDRLVNEAMIPYCAAFLDQGIAHWTLPVREQGFFRSWVTLYRDGDPVRRWLQGLAGELRRIETLGFGPVEVIEEALDRLGVNEAEREEFLAQTLLALRGWAGMIWQMETNAEWVMRPAPPGTLAGYVAVRLILECLALQNVARESLGLTGELRDLRRQLPQVRHEPQQASLNQRAVVVFQLAQVLGWKPEDLHRLTAADWSNLEEEIAVFSEAQRRKIYHKAFERRYRNQALDAVIAHAGRAPAILEKPSFQLLCCIDEREESFRRHVEEIAPRCVTFGVAGFFGVAMYYRGVADVHYVPLCPIVIKPQHYVQEEVVYSFEESHRRRTETRRAIGKVGHSLHIGSRSVIGGAATAILGTLASVPLLSRVLFPRLTARTRRLFGRFVRPPPMTRLLVERTEDDPGPEEGHLGYSVNEMVGIAERVLRDVGLTARFARLIIVAGHGSSSLNNPQRSAYDCGACGGGRGGPNARALAGILNDPRVRERLFRRGLGIPKETVVVGAFHNTCEDSIEYYDLDRLPSSHRDDFEKAKRTLDEARQRNAHERCRRFESAKLDLSAEAALRHVEGRAEDLSQVRPECGHATNAICFVGRRSRTRGLFLDRRAFLTSYDPMQDNEDHAVLTRILQAVIPVCAGISLEYYFCYVDPTGYGCGTKLPHNITSLLGVMDGAASDLRPGLPWQMVEIHEPLRILFIIETTPAAMLGIIDRNPAIRQLVRNAWVQLATLDPQSSEIHLFQRGRFQPYRPESGILAVVNSSQDWYRGWRDHLAFASVVPAGRSDSANAAGGVP